MCLGETQMRARIGEIFFLFSKLEWFETLLFNFALEYLLLIHRKLIWDSYECHQASISLCRWCQYTSLTIKIKYLILASDDIL